MENNQQQTPQTETTRYGNLDNIVFFLTLGLLGVETTYTYPTAAQILSHTFANLFTTALGLTTTEESLRKMDKALKPKVTRRKLVFDPTYKKHS